MALLPAGNLYMYIYYDNMLAHAMEQSPSLNTYLSIGIVITVTLKFKYFIYAKVLHVYYIFCAYNFVCY